ncbi:hypothetical protein BSKO_08312 [Bryopsis sp. KO-2023]|nr:hypothetical protein BSKO_08312 [Bryopsis sp. KO-2023]
MEWLLVPLLLISWLAPASPYGQYDEATWTRSTWGEFKLSKTRSQWRVAEDNVVAKHNQILMGLGYDVVSTIGPAPQVPETGNLDDSGSMSDWLKSALEEVFAGEAVLAPVCWSLVEHTWVLVTRDVQNKAKVTSESIKWHLVDSCEHVKDSVLQSYMLESGSGAGLGDNDNLTGFSLREREVGREVTDDEKKAVHLACHRLLKLRHEALVEAIAPVAASFEAIAKAFIAENKKAMRKQPGGRECEDQNKKCEMWADLGECHKNPGYMLVHCSLSCGVCPGADAYKRLGKLLLLPDQIRNLTESSTKGQVEVTSLACPMVPSESYLHLRPGEVQIIKQHAIDIPEDSSQVDKELHEVIGGHCAYLNQGWWTYETCFSSQIRQIHFGQHGELVAENMLGSFVGGMVDRFSAGEMKKMGMGGVGQPVLVQQFEDGSECERDGVVMKRRATLRVACGPQLSEGIGQERARMTMWEPSICDYVFTVFMADMCKLTPLLESVLEQDFWDEL